MRGTFDQVPPLTTEDTFDGMNIPQAVNTPVPLFNEAGEQVGFFSGSKESEDNCRARMTELLEAS
jgi:hypothetical protein